VRVEGQTKDNRIHDNELWGVAIANVNEEQTKDNRIYDNELWGVAIAKVKEPEIFIQAQLQPYNLVSRCKRYYCLRLSLIAAELGRCLRVRTRPHDSDHFYRFHHENVI